MDTKVLIKELLYKGVEKILEDLEKPTESVAQPITKVVLMPTETAEPKTFAPPEITKIETGVGEEGWKPCIGGRGHKATKEQKEQTKKRRDVYQKEYAKRWREKNKDKIHAYHQEYYKRKKEREAQNKEMLKEKFDNAGKLYGNSNIDLLP